MVSKMDEAQIKSVATMLAAAYWRGRIGLQSPAFDGERKEGPIIEAAIKAAAELDAPNWEPTARLALS